MKIQKIYFISAPIVMAGLLGSCQKVAQEVVARVGKSEITRADLEMGLQELPQAYQQYVASPEGRQRFLKSLIQKKVVLQEARNAGLASENAYKEAVRQSWDRLKHQQKNYEEELLVQSYLRKLQSKELAVTDADVRRYYEDNAADYQKPLEIQASHILVSAEADAQQALNRLKAGEPFEKVAREISKDPATAVRGGKLSNFRRGALLPEFEEAAFRLKPGETSGIVKTQFGFHIIKKSGQTQLPPKTLEDVKEEIRIRLEREKFEQWVSTKQQGLNVTIDQKLVDVIGSRPTTVSSEEPPRP